MFVFLAFACTTGATTPGEQVSLSVAVQMTSILATEIAVGWHRTGDTLSCFTLDTARRGRAPRSRSALVLHFSGPADHHFVIIMVALGGGRLQTLCRTRNLDLFYMTLGLGELEHVGLAKNQARSIRAADDGT